MERSPTAARLARLLSDLGDQSQRYLCREMPSAPVPNTVTAWMLGRSTPTATQWEELIAMSKQLPPSQQLTRLEAAQIKYQTELWIEANR